MSGKGEKRERRDRFGKKFTARELEREVMTLRLAGMSYPEIARRLGRPLSTVHRAGQRALRRIQEETAEAAREYQTLQKARLEKMLAAVWPRVIAGELRATREAARIIRELNRLLGLHRLEITGVMGLQLVWPDGLVQGAEPPQWGVEVAPHEPSGGDVGEDEAE